MKELHIIVGDLNINLLSDTLFADTLKAEFHLTQLITEPTRITSSTATLIDHLHTSQKATIAESGVVNMHISDHCAIFCSLSLLIMLYVVSSIQQLIYSCFYKVNKDAVSANIYYQPWSLLEPFDNIDDATDTFYTLYLNIWDEHAP